VIARRRCAGLALAAVALAATGCAAPRSPEAAQAPGTNWSGRLALQVEGDASQSFSAAFELRGAPQAGDLTLFSPLGGTLAALAWSPGSATLRTGGQERQFSSLEALAAAATGAPLPVAALFDWLAGRNTPVPGWQADLSQLAEGRLRARRTDPQPAADLRIALEP
jgi:outer membrane lipoprotein LolB